MNDTTTRKPNGAYPCPNPVRGGCGCPRSSDRCYGDIRAMREDFRYQLVVMSANDAAAYCAEQSGRRWTAEQVLKRFFR